MTYNKNKVIRHLWRRLMQTKLTLRLEGQLIERAKAHAKKRGKSVSQMVAEYFALLDQEDRPETLAPLTRSLQDALGGTTVDEDTYREHLEEKYL